jgi:hypothetical protein
VRYAAGELTHGLHLLRLPQRLLGLLALRYCVGDPTLPALRSGAKLVLDPAAMVDVDQDAGKSRSARPSRPCPRGHSPRSSDSRRRAGAPDIRSDKGRRAERLGDRFGDAGRSSSWIDSITSLSGRPGAHAFGIEAKRAGEPLVGDEAIGHVPDPGADDRAGVERELHPLGLLASFRLARATPPPPLAAACAIAMFAATRASSSRAENGLVR